MQMDLKTNTPDTTPMLPTDVRGPESYPDMTQNIPCWTGEPIKGAVIGLALQLHYENMSELQQMAASNGVDVFLVEPASFMRFWIEHTDRRLVIFDGRQAGVFLAQQIESCEEMPLAGLRMMTECLYDVPSLLEVACEAEVGKFAPVTPTDNKFPAEVTLDSLVEVVQGCLQVGTPETISFKSLLHSAHRSPTDTTLWLALAAMASALVFTPLAATLHGKADAAKQLEKYHQKVFSVVGQALVTHLRRQSRAKMRRLYQRVLRHHANEPEFALMAECVRRTSRDPKEIFRVPALYPHGQMPAFPADQLHGVEEKPDPATEPMAK